VDVVKPEWAYRNPQGDSQCGGIWEATGILLNTLQAGLPELLAA
jgi:hypothetical protein